MPDRLRRCTYLRITCGSGWAGSLFTPVRLELPVVNNIIIYYNIYFHIIILLYLLLKTKNKIKEGNSIARPQDHRHAFVSQIFYNNKKN